MKKEFQISVTGGSLCFYGDWFGRPCDNYHKIQNYTYENDILCICFDEGEVLRVISPRNIINEENMFAITNAAKVEWIHHLYSDTIKENNRANCYELVDGKVLKTTKYGSMTIKREEPYYAVMLG